VTAPIEGSRRVSLRARVRHHNLPAAHIQLFGREQDSITVQGLTLHTPGRLVTLTGTGGCGKTQLALLVATSLIESFSDGVWLVDLAPVQAATLVPQTVISALGGREQPNEAPSQTLVGWIGRRSLLLLLDNCEHLLDACAQLTAALLDACPNLRLLTTSREPLRISGERVWRVPSLGMPELRSMLLPDQVSRFPSSQLFVQCAQAVKSDFCVTPRNAALVAAICARLEGLPLAIELAAAWVRSLGVDQILERLDDTFELLVGGSRSAPSRQQTMRATMDWSYGLLAEAERVVFQRLAVFVGGWSLEAAESVCSGGTVELHDVLAWLTRLVDASLVQVEEREERVRYRLLEPVRQYAHMCLSALGELDATRRQHAAFFLSFALHWETDANYGGPGRQAALTALERELDNLRAALHWYLEQGDAENGISLGRTLWTFWVARGLLAEGRSWMAQLAALPDTAKAPALRAAAQGIEATFAWRQGDYALAQSLFQAALPHLRQASVPRLLISVPIDLGAIAVHQGDLSRAQAHLEEALAAARAAGQRVDEAIALGILGWVALMQEAYPTARALCEESEALARALGDEVALCVALTFLQQVVLRQGEFSTARRLVEEGLPLARRIGGYEKLADSLDVLGQLEIAEGHYAEARGALRESLLLRHDQGDRSGITSSLETIAALAEAETQPRCAIQLAAAAASIRAAIGEQPTPMQRAMLDKWLVPLQQALEMDEIRSAWEAGRAMSIQQALELGLAATETPPTHPDQPPDGSGQHVPELSPREQQVAALLAQGLTNRQIAEQLVVTQRTVASHIEHILEKLGFASRHQVAVWAAEHGLRAEARDSHRQPADLY
jgi:predicted ATPase/DNA-binding CsgD family transcriptional regulator